MTRKFLFISGSFGLGHVVRDLEIAKELRHQIPDAKITWLAGEPARTFLIGNGETVHPEIDRWTSDTDIIESINRESTKKGKFYNANLIKCIIKSRNAWANNVKLFYEVMKKEHYDLVVGDEVYEVSLALRDRITIKPTFVMIYDFIGAEAMTKNPVEKLIAYKLNYIWAKVNKKGSNKIVTPIFIGESDDIPDKSFGFLLPNRKESVKRRYHFVGYILQFNPEDYMLKNEIRKRLGFGSEPIIICSVGGTSIGLSLLELCSETFPLIKDKIPGIRMVLVAGPRISAKFLNVTGGVTVIEYLPRQYEYFVASDLAIVQAGSTTTLELVALKKPFIYFPVEGHFEQQLHVAPRLERWNAGIKLQYSLTTPAMLAEKIISNIGRQVNYPSIPLDGAKNTVKILKQIIES